MKTYWTLLLSCCLCIPAWAQGQVLVANRISVLGIDAPVFDVDGQTRLEGPAYVAQLYWGFSPESLSPVGPVLNFLPGQWAGYILRHTATIPGAPHGSMIYAQLRAWEARAGASFEAAVAAGGKYGVSNIVPTRTWEPTDPPGRWEPTAMPGPLIGLQSFYLVPEPAPGPLLALGGLAWWLALRRRSFLRRNHDVGT